MRTFTRAAARQNRINLREAMKDYWNIESIIENYLGFAQSCAENGLQSFIVSGDFTKSGEPYIFRFFPVEFEGSLASPKSELRSVVKDILRQVNWINQSIDASDQEWVDILANQLAATALQLHSDNYESGEK